MLAALLTLSLAASLQDADVPDLGTRAAGIDWPGFLGINHDSKSPEKGLKWPAEGPRVVWQRSLGTSYGICSVARGRVFQFDRSGKNAVLFCLRSETGQELWKFEYPSEYDDMYGYEPGPRCCPVIDGDRVYILGVEGLLHCLSVLDGKMIWKKDTTQDFGVMQNFFG